MYTSLDSTLSPNLLMVKDLLEGVLNGISFGDVTVCGTGLDAAVYYGIQLV